jgi:hypothetical protein
MRTLKIKQFLIISSAYCAQLLSKTDALTGLLLPPDTSPHDCIDPTLRPEYLIRRLLQRHPEATIHIQDEQQLAQLLRKAAAAHHSFESALGHPDENWPEWYAQHIVSTLRARDQEPATPALRKPGLRKPALRKSGLRKPGLQKEVKK